MRLALLALLLCACSDALAPSTPELRRIAPSERLAQLYAEAEQCAGQQGRFDAVQWYEAPAPWAGQHGLVHGEFRSPNTIIVHAGWPVDTAVVIHEAKHHILYANGYRGTDHPSPPFGRCR